VIGLIIQQRIEGERKDSLIHIVTRFDTLLHKLFIFLQKLNSQTIYLYLLFMPTNPLIFNLTIFSIKSSNL